MPNGEQAFPQPHMVPEPTSDAGIPTCVGGKHTMWTRYIMWAELGHMTCTAVIIFKSEVASWVPDINRQAAYLKSVQPQKLDRIPVENLCRHKREIMIPRKWSAKLTPVVSMFDLCRQSSNVNPSEQVWCSLLEPKKPCTNFQILIPDVGKEWCNHPYSLVLNAWLSISLVPRPSPLPKNYTVDA